MRIHLLWIACALLSCRAFAQTKTAAVARTDSSVVRIGIRDFKNTQGDKRLDELAESLPHLLRTGLFFEKKFQVTMLGKASESSGGSGSLGLSATGGLDLIVDGEILQVTGDLARVSVVVTDVLRQTTVFRDTTDLELDSEQMVQTMGQLADKLATALRDNVLKVRTADRLTVFVGPFEKKVTDPKLNFLGSSLPLSISGSTEKADLRKNLVVRPVLPNQPDAGSAPKWDIQITGTVTVADNSIVISGTYQDRKGLTFPLEYKGPAAEPLKAVDGFSRQVWQVLAGRVAASGGFRDDPVLAANPTFEKLCARGLEYQKAGDADGAAFFFDQALRKKPTDVPTRLLLAELYRDRESYDQAEEQYAQLIAQNTQNPSVHMSLGVLYAKRGDAKRDDFKHAVDELNQALSLAARDPKLQSEVCMRLGDLYLLMNQPDQAIPQFTRAADLDKSTPAPYLSLAKAYRAKKDQDLDGAVAALKKGLALWPADKSLKNELARTYNSFGSQQKEAKQYAASVKTYQETMALDPPDVRLKAAAYLEAGIILVWNRADIGDVSNLPSGIEWLKKAVELVPDEERHWRALGIAYQRAENYTAAIQNLKKADSISHTYESYWELGFTYRLTGDYDLGVAAVKKAIEMESKKAEAYTLLGALYQSKFSVDKTDKASYASAVEAFQQAMQLDPQSEAAPRILGILYRDAKNYEGSVASLKQALAVKPTVWAYSALGQSYWEWDHKNAAQAIAVLTEGLKLDRRYENFYDNLEEIYSTTGQSQKFTDLLIETTKLDPKFAFPFIKLGIAANAAGRYEEGVAYLQKALAIEPDSEWANRVMGIAYTNIARRDKNDKASYDKAIVYLNVALKTKPTERCLTQFGMIYSDLGDYPKAIDYLKRSLDIDARYTTTYDTLDTAYRELGRQGKQDAAEEYTHLLEAVVAKDPSFYWTRTKLAEHYLAVRRYDDAIAQASKAVSLGGDNPKILSQAYTYLAEAQWRKPDADLAGAAQNARKAIALDPFNDTAIWTFGWAQINQEKFAEGIAELEPLLQKNPKSGNLLGILANLQRLQKSYDKAHQFALQAIAVDQRWSFPHWVNGQAYFDEKKYAESSTEAREAIKLSPEYGAALNLYYRAAHQLGKDAESVEFFKPLLASYPDDNTISSLFYTASHQCGKDKEAMQYLEELSAAHPDNMNLLNSIGFVGHEYTKEFEKAYEAHRKVYEKFPQDSGVIANFAEANLTTGRYDQVLKLAGEALSAPNSTPQSRLSMKLLQVSAYLLKGEQGKAFAELGVFRDDYSKVPADYPRSWTYEGTRSYLQGSAKLRQPEKELLIQMITLLEAPQERAAVELKRFEDSFTKTFSELKASVAGAASRD